MESNLVLPEKFGNLIIDKLIGIGSYGKVYKVTDTNGNPFAIKAIRIPDNTTEEDSIKEEYPDDTARYNYIETLVKDMQEEIETLLILKNNPNVVGIQDYSIEHEEGTFFWNIYIKMELLTPLSEYITEHELSEKDIVKLGIDICNALNACEKHKILHRDIKIGNIMVADDGTFKLGDFGLARQLQLQTSSLSIKGSFAYMAPEVYHGKSYNHLADQYSLGMVLYRLLNKNREPFVDTTSKIVYNKMKEDSLTRRMSGELLPLPVDASDRLAKIVCKACSYEPLDRYVSINQLREELTQLDNTEEKLSELNKNYKNIIYTDDEKIIVSKKHKLLYSAWICPIMLSTLIFCVMFCNSVIDQVEFELWFFDLHMNSGIAEEIIYIIAYAIPILLVIISYGIPICLHISSKSRIRHIINITIGMILLFLSFIVLLDTDIFPSLALIASIYCILALISALIYRKNIIAECIYGNSKEYQKMRELQRKRKLYDKSVEKNTKQANKTKKENESYTKAISKMKNELK